VTGHRQEDLFCKFFQLRVNKPTLLDRLLLRKPRVVLGMSTEAHIPVDGLSVGDIVYYYDTPYVVIGLRHDEGVRTGYFLSFTASTYLWKDRTVEGEDGLLRMLRCLSAAIPHRSLCCKHLRHKPIH
jgi:hypothetical protein